jgi:putative transposase
MRTAYRCRAYPGAEQQVMLNRTFGCVRVVWNRTLAARQARYASGRRSVSYAETDRALTVLKRDPELAWLGEVSCVPLQQALRHQHGAFQSFFTRRARYPRFKSRRGRQSATWTRSAFRIRGTGLYLAKMSEPLPVTWTWPGIDLAGLNPTSVTVARQRIPHPRHMDRHERRLQRWQRRLARCQKGSANRAKARRKVARAHARVTDARRDFLHQASTSLVRRYDVIAVEDLAVANMVRNRSLARAISRTGWAEFRRQLEYKAHRYGRTLVVADRWFPSSKTGT